MFSGAKQLISHPSLRPNIALQRTPLARPLGWARSWGVVACHCSYRSRKVASGAAESWALGIRPQCQTICVNRWREERLLRNTNKRCTREYTITRQHAEQPTEVERLYKRIYNNPSARRATNRGGKVVQENIQ